jgi:hypothetical protein
MTLAAWIDPADDDGRTEASGRITAITDKSTVGNDVSETSSSGPNPVTINGLTVCEHIGATGRSDGLETTGNYSFTGPAVSAAVAYTDDGSVAGSANNMLVGAGDSDGSPGWALYKVFGGSTVAFRVQGQNAAVAGSATADNIDFLLGRYDPARDFVECARNGQTFAAAAATNNPTLTFQYVHGNYQSLNGGWEDGEIGDSIAFDGVWRYDQMQQVEGFLAAKYASDVLPDGHPFKIQAPDAIVASEFMATFEGADAATSYTSIDAGARTATFAGNAQLDEQISKFGGSSLLLDGTGDYLTFPDSTDFDFGSGEFTVEAWVRWSADPTTGKEFIVSHWDANGVSQRAWLIGYDNDNLRFSYSTDGTAVTTVTHAMTLVIDTWFHLAVTRFRGNLLFFVDGVLIGTTAIAVTLHSATSTLDVGSLLQSGGRVTTEDFTGNVDSVRILKGKALYTGNFTPPHRAFREPKTAELIANFNGPDTTTAYTSEDAGARTATFLANAQLDTAQKKFGYSSLLLDGTGDYVTFPDSADFELGAGDFFVEAWVRWSTDPTTTAEAILGKWTTTGDQREWQLFLTNNLLTFQWSTAGTAATVASFNGAFDPVASQWYHIAAKRFDDVMYLYVDGVVVASAIVTATFFAGTSPLMIGGDDSATQDFTGHIDGVRVIKGRAATYHEDLTAPLDRPFGGLDTDYALLLNFEGADAATAYVSDDDAQRVLTFQGAALDTGHRRRGSSSLSGIDADSVIVPENVADDLRLGTGDFTIEMHIRPTTISANDIFYDQRTAATQVRPALYMATGNLRYYVNGADRITGTTLSINTWYHIVLERVDGVTRMYLDGVQDGADYTDANDYLGGSVEIGEASYTTGSGLEGNIDMIRVSIGRAIYNGNFTPPVQGPGEPLEYGHF